MNTPNINLKNVQSVNQEVNRLVGVRENPATSFKDVFAKKLEAPVHFSKHAALRLNDRNIQITGEQMERVEHGIGKADAKGIRDSLVLVDDLALVVNVKTRTVITALQNARETAFSNIDGAVIV